MVARQLYILLYRYFLLKFSSIIVSQIIHSFRFLYVQCYVCAEKPEVNVMLNLETTTVKTLEERILKVGLLKGGFLKFFLPFFRGMDNLRARKASIFPFMDPHCLITGTSSTGNALRCFLMRTCSQTLSSTLCIRVP